MTVSLPRVVLKPRRARPFFARHPWVFAGSVDRVEGEPADGDEVAVISREGHFIARGLFNSRSSIRVRLYRWEDAPLDPPFWRSRLEEAFALRRALPSLSEPGSSARFIFSEADGLSGLTADRYGPWLVVQFTSLALYSRRADILPVLRELSGVEGIYLRTEKGMAEQEGLDLEPGPIDVPPPCGPFCVFENGLSYRVDLLAGQKTGFYLDQRENRRAVAAYARGRRVLDLFCYSGGFALAALRLGEASHAWGFDSSAPAIELARANAIDNNLSEARFDVADVFDATARLKGASERFGLIVCDPPKFARHAASVDDALRGYLRLNRAAVDLLEPGGILATCSCSGLVDRTMFADLIGRVAELTGRSIQLLEQRGASPDHPVSASCLESDYLKCFICRVA